MNKDKYVELKNNSEIARAYIEKTGRNMTINEALQELYKIAVSQENSIPIEEVTFKTFNAWRKEKKFVKKGEKGFMIWSRPLYRNEEGKIVKAESEKENPDDYFFGVTYLFNNLQVE